jgi:hypothetical protein
MLSALLAIELANGMDLQEQNVFGNFIIDVGSIIVTIAAAEEAWNKAQEEAKAKADGAKKNQEEAAAKAATAKKPSRRPAKKRRRSRPELMRILIYCLAGPITGASAANRKASKGGWANWNGWWRKNWGLVSDYQERRQKIQIWL